MLSAGNGKDTARRGAMAIRAAFDLYHARFKQITRRAKVRFERKDWQGVQADAVERLELYGQVIQGIVLEVSGLLGELARDQPTWAEMKVLYSGLIDGRDDFELAETFFNSVTRRVFSTVGVASYIEFVDSDFEPQTGLFAKPIYKAYYPRGSTQELVLDILNDYPFEVPYEDLRRDAALVAAEIDRHLQETWGSRQVERVEIARPVFYRSKGAYLVGRILRAGRVNPLLLALMHDDGGIWIDAVLLTEDEASIVFSFARSYFHVGADIPYQLISFLKTILPLKRTAELYISIGYNKHGKTELYRDLRRHLERTTDRFELARGEKGMVMLVFTMPSYDFVFKVIKDRFGEPKTTTRQEVMERYQLVFRHDRAGRLVDAQEFEHLQFDRDRFTDDLLQELVSSAGSSVTVTDTYVAIKHLYTERRTIPLDIYVREAGEADIREAVVDYGQAIKDLAATNIFPGDILLKNFGVTRHGRVVFYDYDELTLLSTCKFRMMPQARDYAEAFEAEPWFYVGKSDIFPEEFRTFLGLQEPYREVFLQLHSDLFEADFWRDMQKRHGAGEVIDIFPYRQSRRISVRR